MSELSKDVLYAEFKHAIGITYLDHAGATLYSSQQLSDHVTDLSSQLYSNPHSGSPSSKLTTSLIDSTRELVLRHFHTDTEHYDVIFTAGCTAALSLLCHAFPWQGENHTPYTHPPEDASVFCYLDDNHTSVVGMREVAHKSGARIQCVSARDIRVSSSSPFSGPSPPSIPSHPSPPPSPSHPSPPSALSCPSCSSPPSGPPPFPSSSHPSPPPSPSRSSPPSCPSPPPSPPHHLFAYPAQSNFCGCKYPLSWCEDIPSGQLVVSGCEDAQGTWWVVLDAAALVSTSPLDLSSSGPHFVTLSFYKMFGFPTGLGALLVRRDCASLLSKAYYGGGTVKATDSWSTFHVPRDQLHDRLEDGTLPFLDILALRHGFNTLHRLCHSMGCIQQHTFNLARHVYHSLSELKHRNGSRVCLLYCATEFEDVLKQGPIVNFNLLQPDGQILGYHQVEKLANVCDIHLRTGCFCNTGACVKHLGLDSQLLQEHLQQGHECGDSLDIIDGRPTGSIRVSLGYMSTQQDADNFLDFIRSCFMEASSETGTESGLQVVSEMVGAKVVPVESKMVEAKAVASELEMSGVKSENPTVRKDGRGHKKSGCGQMKGFGPSSLISCGDAVWVSTKPDTAVTHPLASPLPLPPSSPLPPSPYSLRSITLYPVKSCAGFKVQSWPVGEKGLLLDREWMVRNEHGSLLSLKQEPKLCLVHPSIDPDTWSLTLAAEGYQPVTIPTRLSPISAHSAQTEAACFSMRVCGDRVQGTDCGEQVSKWLTEVVGRKCRLVRQSPHHKRSKRSHAPNHAPNRELPVELSLVNEAQYLLLTLSSLEGLVREIEERDATGRPGLAIDDLAARFRANFIVESGQESAYAEEDWEEIKIGSHSFQVVGKCVRCQMVCVDPHRGGRSPEPLKTLLALRGSNASFGIYLCTSESCLPSCRSLLVNSLDNRT